MQFCLLTGDTARKLLISQLDTVSPTDMLQEIGFTNPSPNPLLV
jgi:hypothetical protein